MSDFDLAIPFVLAHEGGYACDPKDPGGETDFGISKKSYPNLDIKNLTRDQACVIYKRDFWDKNKYGLINDQAVATKIFDMCVNMGASRAHKIAQEALNVCGRQVEDDGVLGPISIACVNDTPAGALVHVMCSIQGDFYRKLVAEKPTLAKFLNGWLVRSGFPGK